MGTPKRAGAPGGAVALCSPLLPPLTCPHEALFAIAVIDIALLLWKKKRGRLGGSWEPGLGPKAAARARSGDVPTAKVGAEQWGARQGGWHKPPLLPLSHQHRSRLRQPQRGDLPLGTIAHESLFVRRQPSPTGCRRDLLPPGDGGSHAAQGCQPGEPSRTHGVSGLGAPRAGGGDTRHSIVASYCLTALRRPPRFL